MIYNSLGKGEDKYYKTSFFGSLCLWLDPHPLSVHACNLSQLRSGGGTFPEGCNGEYVFMVMSRCCGRDCEIYFLG